jgi:hypothetical protein
MLIHGHHAQTQVRHSFYRVQTGSAERRTGFGEKYSTLRISQLCLQKASPAAPVHRQKKSARGEAVLFLAAAHPREARPMELWLRFPFLKHP